MNTTLLIVIAVIAVVSILLSPKAKTDSTFYFGTSGSGEQPRLLTLIFSQVTTWIFARSLMNSAILGFYYGIWGTLAYATYYLSFITGAKIIDSVRFDHGFNSIQSFLDSRFGAWGTRCYNFVVAIRLVSEVFANLLVIGILFGAAGTNAYTVIIIASATVALFYSMMGGLHASLRTDVFQMSLFLITLAILVVLTIGNDTVMLAALGSKPFVITEPGPILMVVAFLQIWSYPIHDPVMMDRGFLADRDTTRKSFYHAAWISIICIILFGCLGVLAGISAVTGESMNDALLRLLGETTMLVFSITLIISALSTLDSTLSSSAKLVAVDMSVTKSTVVNGRLIMLVFMFVGVLLVFLGNKDLFSAVAVSGTVSMYLLPVIFISLWADNDNIPVWSYLTSFVFALIGATLYFTESSGYTQILGEYHKYTKLLMICVVVMIGGLSAFLIGATKKNSALSSS